MFKKSIIVLAVLAFVAVFSVPKEAKAVTAIEYGMIAATFALGPQEVTCSEGQAVIYVAFIDPDVNYLFPPVEITDQQYQAAVADYIDANFEVEVAVTTMVSVAAIGALTAMGGSLDIEVPCAEIALSL